MESTAEELLNVIDKLVCKDHNGYFVSVLECADISDVLGPKIIKDLEALNSP